MTQQQEQLIAKVKNELLEAGLEINGEIQEIGSPKPPKDTNQGG